MRFTLFWIALLVIALPTAVRAGDWIPLVKGNYWVYRGPTKWLEHKEGSDAKEEKEEVFTCRSEITEVIRRGSITAAVLRGYPADFTWYKPGRLPGEYLIVRTAAGVYNLFGADETKEVLTKIRTIHEDGNIPALLRGGGSLLEAPLRVGRDYGGENTKREDHFYRWHVDSAMPYDSKNVIGLSPAHRKKWTVLFRENADSETVSFVKGIGVVSYAYVHHGTLSETNLRLIEAHVKGESR